MFLKSSHVWNQINFFFTFTDLTWFVEGKRIKLDYFSGVFWRRCYCIVFTLIVQTASTFAWHMMEIIFKMCCINIPVQWNVVEHLSSWKYSFLQTSVPPYFEEAPNHNMAARFKLYIFCFKQNETGLYL